MHLGAKIQISHSYTCRFCDSGSTFPVLYVCMLKSGSTYSCISRCYDFSIALLLLRVGIKILILFLPGVHGGAASVLVKSDVGRLV